MTLPIVPFVKAHACGNDFLIVEAEFAGERFGSLTRSLCDRHTGVGADGVEWIFPSNHADVRVRLFNADGTEAEISGNGTRCVAAHLARGAEKTAFSIETAAGVKDCALISRHGTVFRFSTRMGIPDVRKGVVLALGDSTVTGVEVNIGNPHFVLLSEKIPANWQEIAKPISTHPHFPHGTNIEFVSVSGKDEVDFRIFERGVGPTSSSGTGSCASAAAAIAVGLAGSPVRVHSEGGTQIVNWDGELILDGPAQIVCEGEYFAGESTPAGARFS